MKISWKVAQRALLKALVKHLYLEYNPIYIWWNEIPVNVTHNVLQWFKLVFPQSTEFTTFANATDPAFWKELIQFSGYTNLNVYDVLHMQILGISHATISIFMIKIWFWFIRGKVIWSTRVVCEIRRRHAQVRKHIEPSIAVPCICQYFLFCMLYIAYPNHIPMVHEYPNKFYMHSMVYLLLFECQKRMFSIS